MDPSTNLSTLFLLSLWNMVSFLEWTDGHTSEVWVPTIWIFHGLRSIHGFNCLRGWWSTCDSGDRKGPFGSEGNDDFTWRSIRSDRSLHIRYRWVLNDLLSRNCWKYRHVHVQIQHICVCNCMYTEAPISQLIRFTKFHHPMFKRPLWWDHVSYKKSRNMKRHQDTKIENKQKSTWFDCFGLLTVEIFVVQE